MGFLGNRQCIGLSVLAISLGLMGCQTTGSSIPGEGKVLADYPLVFCAKDGSKTQLVAYKNLDHAPRTNSVSPYCDKAAYEKGEISGYLKENGYFFSGLKGEFHIVCAEGFISLSDPFEIPDSCSLQ
ncbi:hypothetical protein O4H49_13285 [Kiloniella laminariae]|uniref:C-type lysozyme inhibitor domain-containing protein n=1 Tax=Kiloniella laminariae TaxID=454162 RepID=A0ABT4LKX3_9PROT|nr:hypothetical protein [Kiloniella laminariae]MCZ4281758.1 hypothetical protein [Kiloniella laminariae]